MVQFFIILFNLGAAILNGFMWYHTGSDINAFCCGVSSTVTFGMLLQLALRSDY